MAPARDPRRIDGRRLRAVRTRAAIVAALYDLVKEGDPAPTAARIAERAGVALRSIGQHFPSREALLTAVAEHHLARVAPAPAEIPAGGPLVERVAAFVRVRADELERTAPLRRAIAAMPAPSAAVHDAQKRDRDRRRGELAAAFAAEIEAVPASGRARLLDRLHVVTSGPAWDTMRSHLGLPARAAATQMALLLEAVLARA
jgi:AcrR family transcriptional regulator